MCSNSRKQVPGRLGKRGRPDVIVDTESKDGEKIHSDGRADRWETDENYRQQMILNPHTKAELQSGTLKRDKDPVTMKNITNHISCVSRYIWDV